MLSLSTFAGAIDEPIYQGRAIYDEVQPALLPQIFVGRWVKKGRTCGKRDEPNKLVISPSNLLLAGIGMKVHYVALDRRQRPHYDKAIVGVRDSAGTTRTLILDRISPDWLVVGRRGKTKRDSYRRCP